MNNITTIISCAIAAGSLTYIFIPKYSAMFFSIGVVLVLLGLCFRLESIFSTKENNIINKLWYYLTPNDKRYNILKKHCTYSIVKKNEYICERKYEIYPTCNTLDRVNDRFSWSLPSRDFKLTPVYDKHEINTTWEQDMWTCYTVYFNEVCKKHKSYETGSIISNLIDNDGVASPYLSVTIGRKTKHVDMVVKIPKGMHPINGKFRVYSAKSGADEVNSEELAYDNSVGGYTKTINYPRKGWKYVISWEFENIT